MRFVSWNMNYWGRSPAARVEAWDYLRDELRADVALLQEAVPPPQHRSVYRPFDERNPRLNWGSAVVALRPDIVLRARPRVALADCYARSLTGDELPDSHPGACAIADVLDSEGRHVFTAISIYAQWELMGDGRTKYSCARLHRVISDLTGVLSVARRLPMVLAGDFNLTTQIAYDKQPPHEARISAAAFERLLAWGLTDCIAHTRASRPKLENCSCPDPHGCSHVQTYRWANRANGRPTQLDYAFVSESVVPRVVRCEVVQDDAAWQFSDHCPIVLDVN